MAEAQMHDSDEINDVEAVERETQGTPNNHTEPQWTEVRETQTLTDMANSSDNDVETIDTDQLDIIKAISQYGSLRRILLL